MGTPNYKELDRYQLLDDHRSCIILEKVYQNRCRFQRKFRSPISTPDQEIPPSPKTKVRYPVQQSGARRAFQARAPRSARSVAAGGRIFRLRCWRSAIFKQTRSVFGLLVLPVCDFSAGHQQFWAFRTGELIEERRRREKKGAPGGACLYQLYLFSMSNRLSQQSQLFNGFAKPPAVTG